MYYNSYKLSQKKSKRNSLCSLNDVCQENKSNKKIPLNDSVDTILDRNETVLKDALELCHQSMVCDIADIAKRKSDLRFVSNPLYWDPLGNGRGWFHCGQINLPIERVPIVPIEVVKEQIKLYSSDGKKFFLGESNKAKDLSCY